MLAVMAQLGDGVTDIIQRQMAAFLLEAIAHRRGPARGQLLEGRHIQIAVVEETLQLGHAPIEEAPVLADAVAAHGRAAGGHPLLQERQGLALRLGGIDAAFTDPFHQAGLVVLTGIPLIHAIEQLVGLFDRQHRTLGQYVELGVGDHCGDLDDDVLVRIQPGHLQVNPDQIVGVFHGGSCAVKVAHQYTLPVLHCGGLSQETTMAKRNLTRRQKWRIEKIQEERSARANRRGERAEETLLGGDLGPEQEGLVIAHFGVQVDVEVLEGEDRGQVRRCHRRANLPALVTGDRVVWRADNQQSGVIVALQPRRTELYRPDHRGQLKPVAANVDRLVIVFAALPQPHRNLIDRYLVAAEQAQLEPLLVLNKADLLELPEHAEIRTWLDDYAALGYRTLCLSSTAGDGLDTLRQELRGHVNVFVGQSGVGKSSLINALLPDADLRVGALSEMTGKGTHTTTTARLFHFPEGGDLIDSPGIREFGLAHVSRDDVEAGFIEFRDLLGRCRFRDCRHDQEPGCALLQALADGRIQPQRLASYRHIVASLPERDY